MPHGFISTEGSLLGPQSSIGLALTHSFDLHSKEEALVRVSSLQYIVQRYRDCSYCVAAFFLPSPLTAAHSLPEKLVTQVLALLGGVVQELHRPDKQVHSSILLETWLNEVLHTSNPATPNASAKVHLPPGVLLAHLAAA